MAARGLSGSGGLGWGQELPDNTSQQCRPYKGNELRVRQSNTTTLACTQASCAPLCPDAVPVWPSALLDVPVLPIPRPLSRGDICLQPTVLHHCSLIGLVISLEPKAFINVCYSRCTSCSCTELTPDHV